MADSFLNAIFTVVDFVFDISAAIDNTKRLRKPESVDVPAEPRPLPPAAQRALAEAEERVGPRGGRQNDSLQIGSLHPL